MNQRPNTIFRKRLVIPAEHGSWSWLLVPFFVGVLVAGVWNLPVTLVLFGGLAGFLMRQPVSAWLRVRSGRGRKTDGPLAAIWAAGFGVIAVLSLIGLVVAGRATLLWLLTPMALLMVLYLLAARQRRASTRTLWMELAGAASLAGSAPAAVVAATGLIDPLAWLLWALMAGQNVLGVLYVRLRIADTHQRTVNRMPVFLATMAAHIGILALVFIGALATVVPWLAVVPFAGLLLRAAWATYRPRPVANIRRFGFSEIGVEVMGGLLVAAGWLL